MKKKIKNIHHKRSNRYRTIKKEKNEFIIRKYLQRQPFSEIWRVQNKTPLRFLHSLRCHTTLPNHG